MGEQKDCRSGRSSEKVTWTKRVQEERQETWRQLLTEHLQETGGGRKKRQLGAAAARDVVCS